MLDKRFDTKEEAEKELLKYTETRQVKMCPIFKRPCLEMYCESYSKGIVWNTFHSDSDFNKIYDYYIQESCCNNAIVTGTIEYQEP